MSSSSKAHHTTQAVTFPQMGSDVQSSTDAVESVAHKQSVREHSAGVCGVAETAQRVCPDQSVGG